MLIVGNMDVSVDFYKRLLNLEPEVKSPRWSQFNYNNFLIALHAEDSWSDPNDPLRAYGLGQKGESFGLFVKSMDELLKHFKKNKIKVSEGPKTTGLGKIIYVEDPDGYMIQFCEMTDRRKSVGTLSLPQKPEFDRDKFYDEILQEKFQVG